MKRRLLRGELKGSLGMVMGACLVAVGLSCAASSAPTSASRSTTTSTTDSLVPSSSPTTFTPQTFQPVAMSFVNATQGWAMGSVSCPAPSGGSPSSPSSCPDIEATTNGGATWSILGAVPEPLTPYVGPNVTGAVGDMVFANAKDGYLFGPGLQVTTDGAHSWTSGSVASVIQVVVAGRAAYALSQATSYPGPSPATLWRAPLGTNTWSKVLMPPVNPNLSTLDQLLAERTTLLILQPGPSMAQSVSAQSGGLWMSTDGAASWTYRATPCTQEDGGPALASIALGHPDAWLFDCYNGEQSSQETNTQHHLYGTANGGASWVRLADPTHTGAPILMTDNGAGHAFLATEGARNQLVGTFNGGRTWSVLSPEVPGFYGWADLGFVTPAVGFLVGPTHGGVPQYAYRTDDGGHSWKVIAFAGRWAQ